MLHPGHLKYLEQCKEHGDILVVCVSGDVRTKRRKGATRPVMPANQRAKLVAGLKPVDFVFVSDLRPFSEPTLRAIAPNLVVTSSNEPSTALKRQFFEYMRRNHPAIRVTFITRPRNGWSSSKLIKKLKT